MKASHFARETTGQDKRDRREKLHKEVEAANKVKVEARRKVVPFNFNEKHDLFQLEVVESQ